MDVKYGVTDYGNVVEGFTFEYYYYESGKTQEELLSEENVNTALEIMRE